MRTKSEKKPTQRLRFSQTLSGTPTQLLERTATLFEELSQLDKDDLYLPSLDKYKNALVNEAVLKTKSKNGKAQIACCQAQILRLYAPDAPWKETQMTTVFDYIFRQLENIAESDTELCHKLIESLAASNSSALTLLGSQPNAEKFTVNAFQVLLDVARSDTPMHILQAIPRILKTLLEMSTMVSDDVLEIILSYFDESNNSKLEVEAIDIVVQLCKATSDKLSRFVALYFADSFDPEATNNEMELDEEEDDSRTTTDDIENAYELICSINCACSDLLANTIPLFDKQLVKEDPKLRRIATKAAARIFIDKKEMIDKHPETWKILMGRAKDKLWSIRAAFIEKVGPLLLERSCTEAEARETMELRLVTERDERVKVAICNAFGKLDYETIVRYVSIDLFKKLGEKLDDEKPQVQVAAVRVLAQFYNLAYPQIYLGSGELDTSEGHSQYFGWIASQIIGTVKNTKKEARPDFEEAIFDSLLPLPSKPEDPAPWVNRFLTVYNSLPDKQKGVLMSLTNLASNGAREYERYISQCEKYSPEEIERNSNFIKEATASIENISRTFPDSEKHHNVLLKFCKRDDKSLLKLLQVCVDPEISVQKLVETKNVFFKQMENEDSSMVATFKIFFRRCSFSLLNKSAIPILLNKLSDLNIFEKDMRDTTASILKMIARGTPSMALSFIPELTRIILNHKVENNVENKDKENSEIALYVLSQLALQEISYITINDQLQQHLETFIKEGSQKQVNYAAKILGSKIYTSGDMKEFVRKLEDDASDQDRCRTLRILYSLSKAAPEHSKSHVHEISSFVKNMLQNKLCTSEICEDEYNWGSYDDDRNILTLGLKTFTSFCLISKSDKDDNVKTLVKMIWTILKLQGHRKADRSKDECEEEKNEEDEDNPVAEAASILRLEAALCALRIAKVAEYLNMILNGLENLAWVMQDQSWDTRNRFLTKLTTFLSSTKNGGRFDSILFLSAHDPFSPHILTAISSIKSRRSKLKSKEQLLRFDAVFVVFLHLLAHHPDFRRATSARDLADCVKYIHVFLHCVTSEEKNMNLGLLNNLAMKLKMVRDAKSDNHDKLYALSELSQFMIAQYAEEHKLTISTGPDELTRVKQLNLPSDLFEPLSDNEAAVVFNKVFLTEEILEDVFPELKDKRTKKKASDTEGQQDSTKAKNKNKAKEGSGKENSNPNVPSKRPLPKKAGRPPKKEKAMTDSPQDESSGSEAESSMKKKTKTTSPIIPTRSSSRVRKVQRETLEEIDENFSED